MSEIERGYAPETAEGGPRKFPEEQRIAELMGMGLSQEDAEETVKMTNEIVYKIGDEIIDRSKRHEAEDLVLDASKASEISGRLARQGAIPENMMVSELPAFLQDLADKLKQELAEKPKRPVSE